MLPGGLGAPRGHVGYRVTNPRSGTERGTMKVRVIGAAVAASVAAFGLVGCGGSGSDTGGPTTDTTAESSPSPTAPKTPATTAPTAEPSATAASDANAVKACQTLAAHSTAELRDYRVSTEVYVAAIAAKDARVHAAAKDLARAGEDIRDGDFTGDFDGIVAAMKAACEPYSAS